MRNDQASTTNHEELTILIAGTDQNHSQIASRVRDIKARLIFLPEIEFEAAPNLAPLDEAIANLYGYDWIVFKSLAAVEYFLERFGQLGHKTSDLDSLRVCAIGNETLRVLEEMRVHVDLF